MFIASKLADPCPITGTELVRYTNDTYNLTELLVSVGRLPGFENFIGWVCLEHPKMVPLLIETSIRLVV